jgi:hypothetical protein
LTKSDCLLLLKLKQFNASARIIMVSNKQYIYKRLTFVTGGLVSYTMPQGSKVDNMLDFRDFKYNGTLKGLTLRDGLGCLSDGQFGAENLQDNLTKLSDGEYKCILCETSNSVCIENCYRVCLI